MKNVDKSFLIGVLCIAIIVIGIKITSSSDGVTRKEQSISELRLELALTKTENRVLTRKLDACQNPPVVLEPRPIIF